MNENASVHPSDSTVQRAIEVAMLGRIDVRNADWNRADWTEVAKKYQLPVVWQKAKPDAVWETKTGDLIVAECYTRVEKLKPGNYGKLAKDCIKLIGIERVLAGRVEVRCPLIVPDEMANQLQGSGWLPTVIRQSVEIVQVSLLATERDDLNAAAFNQAKGQSRTRRNPDISE